MNRLIFISLFFLLSSTDGASDTIFFKDGNQLNVPDTWEEDGKIKFRQDNSTIVGYEKTGILKVEKNILTDNPQLNSGNEIVESKIVKSDEFNINDFLNYNEACIALAEVQLLIIKGYLNDKDRKAIEDYNKKISKFANFMGSYPELLPNDFSSKIDQLNKETHEKLQIAMQLQKDGNLDEAQSVILQNLYSVGSEHKKICDYIISQIQSSKPIQKEIIQSDRNFIFDGFQWNILNLKKFRKIGRAGNPQYSKNGCFVVVEAIVKNISNEPKYYCDFILLGRDKQYSKSSTVTVYGEYNLGYESNSSTKFEPGSNLQIFFGFDAIDTDEYTLILKNYDDRKKIKLTNFSY